MMALQRFAYILDFYLICLVLVETLEAFFRYLKIDYFLKDTVESAVSYCFVNIFPSTVNSCMKEIISIKALFC